MTTATIRRERHAVKETLKAFDPARKASQFDAHYGELTLTGRTLCLNYGEAIEIKRDYDEAGKLLGRKAIIKPEANGWTVVSIQRDDEPLARSSEVLELVMQAEEWGTTVDELMGRSPGRTAISSGNVGKRRRLAETGR